MNEAPIRPGDLVKCDHCQRIAPAIAVLHVNGGSAPFCSGCGMNSKLSRVDDIDQYAQIANDVSFLYKLIDDLSSLSSQTQDMMLVFCRAMLNTLKVRKDELDKNEKKTMKDLFGNEIDASHPMEPIGNAWQEDKDALKEFIDKGKMEIVLETKGAGLIVLTNHNAEQEEYNTSVWDKKEGLIASRNSKNPHDAMFRDHLYYVKLFIRHEKLK